MGWKEEADVMIKKRQEEVRQREEAESLVASLGRKILLLEEDLDRAEERYNIANNKLATAAQSAEESNRLVNSLECKSDQDGGKLFKLEDQVLKAKVLAEEADKKYEEAARKLALVEADLERAEERAEASESKMLN